MRYDAWIRSGAAPQDQIQAFRAFQVSSRLQERFGYPPLTQELRVKVFGLSATRPYAISAAKVRKHADRDCVARERVAYRAHPEPYYLTYGPKTRRQFLKLLRWNGGARS